MPSTEFEARRRLMSESAARVLIEEGPAAVTHRRVARAAGIPPGSANYVFPTRRELYAAAVQAAEELRGSAAAAFAESAPAGPAADAVLARRLLDTWYAPRLDSDVAHVRVEPILAATGDPELQSIMHASRPRLLAALGLVIERTGRPAHADPELLARVLDGAILHGASTGGDAIETATDTVARFLALTLPARREA